MRSRIPLFIVIVWCFSSVVMAAVPKVTFSQLQEGGWERYMGQTVCITSPLVLCATMYDSLILSPERLFVPEEHAYGLADGDSTVYWQRVAYNRDRRIKLECRYSYDLNLGATITGLTARVAGVRHLQTGVEPAFRNYRPSKKVPAMPDATLRICAANVQNYFVHVGGYATKRNTAGQHALQCYKVASALTRLDADIYTLCELEKGESAPRELVAKMNALMHWQRYAYVTTDIRDGDTISVGFIYRSDKVRPVGDLRFAYDRDIDSTRIYAYRFMLQGWEQIASGERFVISLNHPRSKRGDPVIANAKRMNNIRHILSLLDAYRSDPSSDPDILLLGDYNSYAQEQPLQTLVRAGYSDLVMAMDSTNYSYSYRGECGYLDRAYASPSMAKQVVALQPVHWNTDYHYSAAYYAKYNYKNRNIPKDAPKRIQKFMTGAAKRNLLFRYSDHDPLLIGLKLTR